MFWTRDEKDDIIPEELTAEEEEAIYAAREVAVQDFWGSLRIWFLEKGYTLFQIKFIGSSLPSLKTPSRIAESPEWPYAFCGDDCLDYTFREPLEGYVDEKICFAQDSQGRHVAIKRLDFIKDTDEFRIIRFLYENRHSAEQNCILPILELLEHEEHCFAVMPRWGEDPFYPHFGSMKEGLLYIHCLLKAIHFLHVSSIVHRDIKLGNTLVNHFGAHHCCMHGNRQRQQLRSAGKLTYALFDFDLAVVVPSTTNCRLPAQRSFEIVSVVIPYDTMQGELDYDPFLFEMGCLGIVLCQEFQQCTQTIPFLAPFLDRLVTHKLNERFTSLEALRFFEQMYAQLTPTQLSLPMPEFTKESYHNWEPEKYDRWRGLPEDFVKQWKHLRAPIPSVYIKILRRICRTVWGQRFVMAVRRFYRFAIGHGLAVLSGIICIS